MMPSLNGSRRRHPKQSSSSRKKLPPPDLTLSSRYSSSSNNSDTQVTPRSIFPSSLRPSKRAARDAKPTAREEALRSHPVERDSPERRSVDVFAYMEKDNVSWDSPVIPEETAEHEDAPEEDISPPVTARRQIEPPQFSSRYSDLEVKAIQETPQQSWGRGSLDGALHSDSGISVHSTSPEDDSPVMKHKYPVRSDNSPIAPLEPSIFAEDELQSTITQRDSPDFSDTRAVHHHVSALETSEGWVPEACQFSPSPMPNQHEVPYLAPQPRRPTYTQAHLEIPPHDFFQHRSATISPFALPPSYSQERTGYALLASNITTHRPSSASHTSSAASDAVLKPIYRKFETLNNRMLLYLQDEISELECQLNELDAAIAVEQLEHAKGVRQSRRIEAKLPSQLQWHRMDLLARAGAKVDQYNRALTSYASLNSSLSPASSADIAAYKSWIDVHAPIAGTEVAFLGKEGDLITVVPPPPQIAMTSSDGSATHRLENPAIVLAFAFLATVVFFKVVPNFFARLVISTVVGLTSLCLVTEAPLKWENVKALVRGRGDGDGGRMERRRKGVALYAIVGTVLALLL